MKHLKLLILVLIIAFSAKESYSQNNLLTLGLWNLYSVSGELKMGGIYGEGNTDVYGLHNFTKSSKLYGGILLKTSSYIWTPKFLILDIDGGYFPQSNRNQYLIFPSYSDVLSSDRLHMAATFFQKKPVTISMYMNLDESYDSRENLTDIKSNSKNTGGMLAVKYRVLPFTVSYNQSDWTSKELATGRTFNYFQKNWDYRATKSFGKRDRSEFIYTRHDYTRKDFNIAANRNIYDNIELRNKYNLDSTKTSYLTSDVVGTSQAGIDSYKQIRLSENLIYRLRPSLKLNSGYSYINTQRRNESLLQNNFNSVLSHQLFLSLHTDLMYEYIGTNETSYNEASHKIGGSIGYTKKIPTNGTLAFNYTYNLLFENKQSTDATLQVMNEPYVLADNLVVTLKLPNVDIKSVQVKDISGTIVYQLNIDYILLESNNYVEIRRIPGGQIANNSTVYLYYSATELGSLKYSMSSNNFNVNVSFFSQLINFYYTKFTQDYFNIVNTSANNLNYLTSYIYGARSVIKFLTIGVEYNDYESSIYPYRILRYYGMIQGNIKHKLNYAINVNSREYLRMPTDSTHRLYQDVGGLIAYSFDMRTKIDLSCTYQNQDGRDINLDLITGRFKFTKTIRRFVGSFGIDAYKRRYLNTQRTDYFGGYIQIVKKF